MNNLSLDQEPYVLVRWHENDVQAAVLIDANRRLYIPREFEAAIVASDLTVHLELQAAAALRDVFESAGKKPPELKRDVLIKRVEISTDAFFPGQIPPERARQIPFATYTKWAVAATASTRAGLRERVSGSETLEGWRRKATFDELVRRKRGRPRLEENDGEFLYLGERLVSLDEVLKIRNASTTPTKALMEHFHIPKSTAQYWSRRAVQHRARWIGQSAA
jgi:hypothetical protein